MSAARGGCIIALLGGALAVAIAAGVGVALLAGEAMEEAAGETASEGDTAVDGGVAQLDLFADPESMLAPVRRLLGPNPRIKRLVVHPHHVMIDAAVGPAQVKSYFIDATGGRPMIDVPLAGDQKHQLDAYLFSLSDVDLTVVSRSLKTVRAQLGASVPQDVLSHFVVERPLPPLLSGPMPVPKDRSPQWLAYGKDGSVVRIGDDARVDPAGGGRARPNYFEDATPLQHVIADMLRRLDGGTRVMLVNLTDRDVSIAVRASGTHASRYVFHDGVLSGQHHDVRASEIGCSANTGGCGVDLRDAGLEQVPVLVDKAVERLGGKVIIDSVIRTKRRWRVVTTEGRIVELSLDGEIERVL